MENKSNLSSEAALAVILSQMTLVTKNMEQLQRDVQNLTVSMSTLAVIEERLIHMNKETQTALKDLKDLEIRVQGLEQTKLDSARTTRWLDMAVVGACATFLSSLVNKLHIF